MLFAIICLQQTEESYDIFDDLNEDETQELVYAFLQIQKLEE